MLFFRNTFFILFFYCFYLNAATNRQEFSQSDRLILPSSHFQILQKEISESLTQTQGIKNHQRIETIATYLQEKTGVPTTVLCQTRAAKLLSNPDASSEPLSTRILNTFHIFTQDTPAQPSHSDLIKEMRALGISEAEIDANIKGGLGQKASFGSSSVYCTPEESPEDIMRMLEAAGISQDDIAFSQRFGQTPSAKQPVEVVSQHLPHTSSAAANPSIEWREEFEDSAEYSRLPKVSSPKFLTLQGKPNKDSITLLHRNVRKLEALDSLSGVSKVNHPNLKYVFDDLGFSKRDQIHLSLLSGIGSTRASSLFVLDNIKTLLKDIQPLCLTNHPFKITGLDFYVHDEKNDTWRTFNLDTQDSKSIIKDLKTCPDINYGYVVLRAQGIEENPASCSLKTNWTNPSFLESSQEFSFARKMPYNPHITIAQVGVEDTSALQQFNKKAWVKWQPADVESIVTAISKIRVSTDELSNLALGKIAVSTKVRGEILSLGYNDLDSHTVRVNRGLWESTFRGDY